MTRVIVEDGEESRSYECESFIFSAKVKNILNGKIEFASEFDVDEDISHIEFNELIDSIEYDFYDDPELRNKDDL
jgi:hypothetical protein